MVNVDRVTIQVFAQRRRQYLHVAGEHHQIDVLFGDEGTEFRFLKELGRGRYRRVHERCVRIKEINI